MLNRKKTKKGNLKKLLDKSKKNSTKTLKKSTKKSNFCLG